MMSNDSSPLESMGAQSQETVNMAAAMAHDAVGATDGAGSVVAAVGSKIGEAAGWATGQAKDVLQSAAEQVRERATRAVETYTREDPIRAILIAAGTGALLMALIATLARSGVRRVERSLRRQVP